MLSAANISASETSQAVSLQYVKLWFTANDEDSLTVFTNASNLLCDHAKKNFVLYNLHGTDFTGMYLM